MVGFLHCLMGLVLANRDPPGVVIVLTKPRRIQAKKRHPQVANLSRFHLPRLFWREGAGGPKELRGELEKVGLAARVGFTQFRVGQDLFNILVCELGPLPFHLWLYFVPKNVVVAGHEEPVGLWVMAKRGGELGELSLRVLVLLLFPSVGDVPRNTNPSRKSLFPLQGLEDIANQGREDAIPFPGFPFSEMEIREMKPGEFCFFHESTNHRDLFGFNKNGGKS
nr:hypothetical protein [Sulfidibacter corallicola]